MLMVNFMPGPSCTLHYFKEEVDNEVVMMMATTPLKELFNLRWYIQYLIDECESDDDDLDNHLNEDNWLFQTRRKLMKYVIYNGHVPTNLWTRVLSGHS